MIVTKRCVLTVLALTILLAAAPQSLAQTPSTVLEVRIEGNQRVSDAAVLSQIKTRAGEPYDEATIAADEKRLMETRQYTGVVVTKTATEEGVIVTFTVAERAVVVAVELVGNEKIKTSTLTKKLTIGAGDPVDRFLIEQSRKALENLYREKGYSQASVTVDAAPLGEGKVVYHIDEGVKTIVRKIRFEGNTHLGWWKLRTSISSQVRLWPFLTGALDEDKIARDVDTLRNLYTDDGFLDAKVTSRLDFSDDRKKAVLTFEIDQGPRYRIGELLFNGNTVFSDSELAGRLSLQSGEFFTTLAYQRDIKKVQEAYGEIGYINATVQAARRFPAPAAEPAPALVNLVFDIAENDQYTVGKIDIRGNTVTQDRVIRRELRFFPEQLFNTVAVGESRRGLLETRLFNDVTIVPEGAAPGMRNAVVTVDEGQTGQILLGVGVSTNSGVIGTITYTQRNFDILGWPNDRRKLFGNAWKGAGQTLTLSLEPGTEMNQAYIDWFEPRLFDKEYSLGQKLFFFDRARETYDEQRFGYVPSVGHRFPNGWYVELSGRLENVSVKSLDSGAPPEVVKEKGNNFLAGPKLTFVRDRTDSRWTPSRGDRFQLTLEQIAGDYTFSEITGTYRYYRTLWLDALDRKHILAARATAGRICGDSPVFERFYGGGIGSIRGFDYRGISPRSAGTDDQIGGEFLLLAGAEYSFPLVGEVLRGVVFLDTGTVEKSTEITTYRASAGFGMRWIIPLMGEVPMSFDFGFPIAKSSEDDTQVFSFSIGWSF